MSLTTAKFTELTSLSFTFSSPNPSLSLLRPFSRRLSLNHYHSNRKNTITNPNANPNLAFGRRHYSDSAAPWISKWPSLSPLNASSREDVVRTAEKREEVRVGSRYFDKDRGSSAIERIVLRLRNLGLGSDDEEGEEGELRGGDIMPVSGDEKLGDLLQRDWLRPDKMLVEDEKEEDMALPWERDEELGAAEQEEDRGRKKRMAKAPTLAELTIEDEELRRLRRLGMRIREKINVPKAGITQAVLEKIHDKWRKEELVRLKFHEALAHDMKRGHEIVERRTGGLVTWRSGSVMVVFRGSNYGGPASITQPIERECNTRFIPDVSSVERLMMRNANDESVTPEKSNLVVKSVGPVRNMTEEEAEYNSLLDGLGPRFVEWWGTGILPVDADLLPQTVPGYKTPFRLLPTGMRSRLTNAELTSLRKLAKSLPCHFALGRNRRHQGLAAAILKLWEKSLVVKIAVKPGIQNTNNKLMSEELKNLTGGVLLLRNKYFIVMYRGKDFLPTSVSAALAERQELTKEIQNVEENVRGGAREVLPSGEDQGHAIAGTLAEFYEAQARWGREISTEEQDKMLEEASRAKSTKVVKRMEHKLAIAQAKKLRAERLLAKIEGSMVPIGPSDDQETITDEERFMFRRVGLKMKAYLPLGIRGVFDGVIENMHLHWKHRELVKLISKQKTLSFVEETARLLEYESGGILVAIERVPKGYAIIYYRGKNYRRPVTLRPRNLLTKAKALKRSVAMQRHEALSQHITELERTVEQMKIELGVDEDVEDKNVGGPKAHGQFNTQSEDEASNMDSDGNDDDSDENFDWEDDEESRFDI